MKRVIIGMGNEYRGDDAAGLIVARRLGGGAIESSGDGAALIEAWRGAEVVIVIDAARSGAPAGTIHRFDARERELPREAFASTHAFGLAEAVELSRALGELPPRMIVYAVEGAGFDAGAGLSPEVERAIGVLVERIRQEWA